MQLFHFSRSIFLVLFHRTSSPLANTILTTIIYSSALYLELLVTTCTSGSNFCVEILSFSSPPPSFKLREIVLPLLVQGQRLRRRFRVVRVLHLAAVVFLLVFDGFATVTATTTLAATASVAARSQQTASATCLLQLANAGWQHCHGVFCVLFLGKIV